MPLDPLAEFRAELEKLKILFRTRYLERSSVDDGMMRFINSTLRVESGGRVEIIGTLQVDGQTTVTGSFEMAGDFTVTGPWNLKGAGVIEGDVTITGKVTQVGDMDVDGVFTLNGDGWSITGDGEISGKVNLTGSLEVAEGGYIQVGPTRISGSAEGFISSMLAIVMKAPIINITGALGVSQGAVFEGSVSMPGLIPIALADAPAGAFVGVVYRDGANRLRVVVN